MRLVLFDLDMTLLAGDSDRAWASFIARTGVVNSEEHEELERYYYAQYVNGTLDIHEFLQFHFAPLTLTPKPVLDAWRERFVEEEIRPMVRREALQLVDSWRKKEALMAIVTATNRYVAEAASRLFAIDALIATELEEVDGVFTGKAAGTPAFREGKILRVEAWLASLGRTWDDFSETWFYSDSHNDLPLLERVNRPVATNPDAVLLAHAQKRGWPIIELYERKSEIQGKPEV